ncbi:hypothetical protein [Herbidospora sp. RD11066]
MKPQPNAICIGGPSHGLLLTITQEIGILDVEESQYRVTTRRLHHPSCREPFVVLAWAEDPGLAG